MSADTRPIALIGATGNQGRHVVDELLRTGNSIRALVRDSGSAAARDLVARGVDVVEGDQNDSGSLTTALDGVSALWFMTTFEGPGGTDGEATRGINVANAAATAHVPRVLFTSVGGAERHTGIPHFESKRRVEQRLIDSVPTSVLRPVFFMENLLPQLTLGNREDIVIRLPLPEDTPLQIVAVRDVGRAAARWVADPTVVASNTLELAAEETTLGSLTRTLTHTLGVPARYEQIPLEYLPDEDLRLMFRWFANGDGSSYRADFTASHTLLPDITTLPDWVTELET